MTREHIISGREVLNDFANSKLDEIRAEADKVLIAGLTKIRDDHFPTRSLYFRSIMGRMYVFVSVRDPQRALWGVRREHLQTDTVDRLPVVVVDFDNDRLRLKTQAGYAIEELLEWVADFEDEFRVTLNNQDID